MAGVGQPRIRDRTSLVNRGHVLLCCICHLLVVRVVHVLLAHREEMDVVPRNELLVRDEWAVLDHLVHVPARPYRRVPLGLVHDRRPLVTRRHLVADDTDDQPSATGACQRL